MKRRIFRRLAVVLAAAAFPVAGAQAGGADPIASEVWADIVDLEFAGAPMVYDDSFYLVAPERVEEAFSVPVSVGFADTPYEIAEVAVFAENNPFVQVARVLPHRPIGGIGFDIRLERSTPVRAAVRDTDGVWHVAHRFVEVANPGGCSALRAASAARWAKSSCASSSAPKAKAGSNCVSSTRCIPAWRPRPTARPSPAYYIERMTVTGDSGPLAELTLWASVAADPTFIFDLPESQSNVRVAARDTAGALFERTGAPARM